LAVSPDFTVGETFGFVRGAVFFGIVRSSRQLQVRLHVMQALGPRVADQGSI
jgi:hypothetical protein